MNIITQVGANFSHCYLGPGGIIPGIICSGLKKDYVMELINYNNK